MGKRSAVVKNNPPLEFKSFLSLKIQSFVLCCCVSGLMLFGCAITKQYLTDSERASLGVVAIAKVPEVVDIQFSVPVNLFSGIAEGACAGGCIGVYPLCLFGIPVMVPYGIGTYGSCAWEFGDIQNPKEEFEQGMASLDIMTCISEAVKKNMMADTGTELTVLESRLRKIDGKVYDCSLARSTGVDTLIQFNRIVLKLDNGLGDIGECFFFMELNAEWSIIRASDGVVLAVMSEEVFDSSNGRLRANDLYKDNLALAREMASVLVDSLAARVVIRLRGDKFW